MTVIHIVLFKFLPTISTAHKTAFITELKKLKLLPCVLNNNLIVGGPSITDPIERSKGFEIALLSFHKDLAALSEYQASKEHHNVTSKYLWDFKEDVVRFDFEVDGEDEGIITALGKSFMKGVTAQES